MQALELVSMSMKSACCWPELSWKSPTLSSVPAGMADGSIVMVGCTPDLGVTVDGQFCDTTCEKPAGAGSEEHRLPVVTFAGMPYCARSLCRAAGSSSSPGLIVSVAVPLELLASVKAAVRIVPGVGRAEHAGQTQGQRGTRGGDGHGHACDC